MQSNFLRMLCCLLVLLAGMAQRPLSAQTVTLPEGDDICPLSELDLSKVTYFNDGDKNAVQANLATYGTPLVVGGTTYASGVGTHAPSKLVVQTNGATDFSVLLGIDDAAGIDGNGNYKQGEGVVDFVVTTYNAGHEATVCHQGTLRRTDNKGYEITDLDLSQAVYLVIDLQAGENAYSDHVDLCNAYFHYAGEKPQLISESDMWSEGTIDIPEPAQGLEHVALSSLEIGKSECGWGTVQADKSIEGNSLKLKGKVYSSGVGTHGPSRIIVKLNGSVTDFHAVLGIDDEVLSQCSPGSAAATADYRVYLSNGNGNELTVSEGTISVFDEEAVTIHADVNGWKYLYLETDNGVDGNNACDHVDWACAYFVYQEQNSSRPIIVTAEEISSKLACATTVFSQPDVRFMQKIRTANPESTVEVTNLPEGLTWNAERQLVEGILKEEGVYTYTAHVLTDGEETLQDITLTVSRNLPLPVPFMGWISWNSVEGDISQDIVEQVVELFKNKGLVDCGWNAIVLDDLWHAGSRAADGSPQPNATRFPNGMAAVAKVAHDAGMKFGIYSDAAEYTCAGAFGSYGHETIDANKYAEWGVDLVKYDYCNAPSDAASAQERYSAMADALRATDRNMVLYICEWGQREPWKWGAEAGGSCWRVSYDVRDCWTGVNSGVGVVQSLRDMKDLAAYQGVNRFNDADMLCTGLHGTGKSSNDLCGGDGPGMTQDEYRTQFALWCMWSSPLSISLDPRNTSISDEDFAILTNKELIALDQDLMGQQADLIDEADNFFAFAKDCENGDIALSVTNMENTTRTYTFRFDRIPHLDAGADYTCRDLWKGEDLPVITDGTLQTTVAPHATQVFRLARKDVADAIGSPLTQPGSTIVAQGDKITVSVPGASRQAKRIIVSDMAGRVVQAATFHGSQFQSASLPQGVYVVNLSCGAQVNYRTIKI